MKVLHVVESFGGGIINFVQRLTTMNDQFQHNILYNERELEIAKIMYSFPSETKFIKWTYAQREINLKNDFLALLYLYKIIKTSSPDVVHLHSTKAGILGQFISRLFPKVVFIYSPNGASFARKDISRLTFVFYILIERLANYFGHANLVCVSKSELELYRRFGFHGTFINNGIETDSLNDPRVRNFDELIIVNTGRIADQKNPFLFNEIANLCAINQLPVKFIWIGSGSNERLLSSRNIRVTGWIPNEEVLKILHSSSIYLSTSLWEGLSFALLEGMRCKLAILATSCVGNVDLVENDKNGYLFSLAEEAFRFIENYCHNSTLLIKHQEYSYIKLKTEFDANEMITKYKNLYNDKYFRKKYKR
jgi:glycosyltransferase involved in cell wall biosynthesis